MTTDADRRRAEEWLRDLVEKVNRMDLVLPDSPYWTIRAALAGRDVPEGWKLVPIVPISDMTDAGVELALEGVDCHESWSEHVADIYRAMLDKAPLPQQHNSGGSYGLPTSPSEGMEPISNAGSPESRPDADNARKSCCALSFSDHSHFKKGATWYVTYLPKGYGPTNDDIEVCAFPDQRWGGFELKDGKRPPLIQAVMDAIEKIYRQQGN